MAAPNSNQDQAWMRYLSERGITQVDQITHSIVPCGPDRLEEVSGIYGKGYPNGTHCLVFPHVDLHGHDTGYRSARFIVPDKAPTFGKAKLKVQPNSLVRAHFPITNTFQKTLYITESWLKAVILSKHGKFAVGVNGCYGWSGGKNSEMIEDLWRFPWGSIERLVIVWDSDIRTNPNVQAAACNLFHKLKFVREADIEIVLLAVPDAPDGSKWGIDDWIASGTFDLDTFSTFDQLGIDVHDSPFYELNSKVCYVSSANLFVDLEDCSVMNERHFHTRYAPVKIDNKDGNPVCATRPWIGWGGRHERAKIVNRPGSPRLVDGAVNLWSPGDVSPVAGDVSVHEEFLRRAVPDERERLYLKQWVGHAVQHPEVKMNVAMVFFSPEEGTGKTMTANAIGSMLGKNNVASITLAQLREGFNSSYATKQLVIMNENNKGVDSKPLLEKLKTFITEREVMVRQMHTNPYPAENYANVILTMNHADALPMSAHDRRFNIVQFYPALVADPAWAEVVWEWHRDNPSALLHYYLNVDLEGFDPFKAPPMNEAKRELTTAAADRWTRAVIDLCTDPAEFFQGIGWRADIRYLSWSDLARQIWHSDTPYVDATRLQGDSTKLGLAFKAQASHYGFDPQKCIKKGKFGGKVTTYIDLTPNAEENFAIRTRDAQNPRGEKIGG